VVDVFEESLNKMKANTEATEAIVERQELRIEEMNMNTIRAMEDRYGDQHLVASHRQKPMTWTQGSGEFQKNSATA
jgi:hypothetical protein